MLYLIQLCNYVDDLEFENKSQIAIITVVLSICDFGIQSYHNRK